MKRLHLISPELLGNIFIVLSLMQALPLTRFQAVVSLAVSRLQDKSVTVIKNAIQLLAAFLLNNPFSCKVNLCTMLEFLRLPGVGRDHQSLAVPLAQAQGWRLPCFPSDLGALISGTSIPYCNLYVGRGIRWAWCVALSSAENLPQFDLSLLWGLFFGT